MQKNIKVWVPRPLSGEEEMFIKHGFSIGDEQDYDVLCLCGGRDIPSSLYNAPTHYSSTKSEVYLDTELPAFEHAIANGKVVFGICRGMQLIHALLGGTLYQHLIGHSGHHHLAYDNSGNIIKVNSLHHQNIFNDIGGEVLLQSSDTCTGIRWCAETNAFINEEINTIEAILYKENKCLGVQGHPEGYGCTTEYTMYCMNLLKEKLLCVD